MDSNNNVVVIHDGDNGTEVNTNRDNSTNDDDKQTIYNHPGGKARSQVWKVFGFFKKEDRQGPGTRENLDMTKAVCRLCRKEYTNKGLYFVFKKTCCSVKLFLNAKNMFLYDKGNWPNSLHYFSLFAQTFGLSNDVNLTYFEL